jgi:hypothetical protein
MFVYRYVLGICFKARFRASGSNRIAIVNDNFEETILGQLKY